jgi:hypothetical protein
MSTLKDRFTQLVAARTDERRRFKYLEEQSGIPSVSWRRAFDGDQRPTAEMIETVAGLWPEHAFWLVSGWTDNEFSHVAPDGASTLDVAFESRPAGVEFLRLRGELQRLQLDEKRSLKDRWEDWLTEQQERNREKYPWAFSVHPTLAKRKSENLRRAKEKEDRMRELAELVDRSHDKRLAEFFAIHGRQEK